MNWKAARTSAGLCLLFTIVYGGTNWLAAQRSHVPSIFFEWERHIPFVPLFIIPYMLIDAFFVAAPFLCRSDLERRTLARRLAAATLIAGAFFLLMPLRFAFERPHLDGFLGAIFNTFRQYDQPFNEFPSLHITFGTILAVFYAARFRGIPGALLALWFVLVRLSALLTYQHHVIDVIGGFALAALCLHLFQDEPLRQPLLPNRRVGTYYLLGALALGALALAARPWSWLLLWPALSLALTASAYFFIGPGIYRKHNGRHPLTTRLLLWPVLLGQRLSLMHYARHCKPWDALTDRLWIGRTLTDAEARRAVDSGIIAVIDLTGEFAEARPFRALPYLQLPILDLTAPTPDTIAAALVFLHEHTPRGIVYLHCKIGYSRTAAIAGAWLLETRAASTPDEAMSLLRAARPSIVIRPEIRRALTDFRSRSLTRHHSAPSSAASAPSPTTPES